MNFLRPLVVVLCGIWITWSPADSAASGQRVDEENEWFRIGQHALKSSLKISKNEHIAKNVIFFLGDGMGVSTVTSARIYYGQKQGKSGEEGYLSFEKFPNVALAKTYNTDRQVPDSAGTATAMLSGVKTRLGAIGVNHNVPMMDCGAVAGNEVDSILDWSHEKGKWTGLVTTTRITHASPAAAYGHSPWRFWETDASIDANCQGKIDDLAKQLLVDNRYIRVILGGGRSLFTPKTAIDPEYKNQTGKRIDGRNLIQEWGKYHLESGASGQYVWNQSSFEKVDPDKTDYLLGIFEPDHMQFELDRQKDAAGEPSLADMTEKAIKLLQRNDKGYFLMVEGGRIDHGHHLCNAKRALEDTVAFDEAIRRALDMTNDKDTLIVVTADHSHTFTLGGYTPRGNDILGVMDDVSRQLTEVYDDFPVTSLAYANGPGPTKREDMFGVDTTADDFKQPVAVPMKDETHAGEDVAVYARGPMAHLIHGVQEQSYIAHVMAYASCVGVNTGHCDMHAEITQHSSGATFHVNSVAFVIPLVLQFISHYVILNDK